MAAAFGALVSIQNNLYLIQNNPRYSFSFADRQIQSLRKSVDFLIHLMRSHDDAHGARKEAAEALEMRIARAAEAAEDVVESHVVDQIRDGKTRSPCFLLDLQKVIQDMDYMCRKGFQVYSRSELEPTYHSAPSSSTPPTSNKTTMVGFDDVLLQLLDNLTGFPSSREIIPIVGMGGIGKTTLATNAFQHPLIVHHFDVCLWATISQHSSLEKIIVQLLSHLRKSTSGTVDEVQERLYKSLYGPRYLIVLDDMWTVEAWDEIKFLFPDTKSGSRVVVTTRQLDVATYLATSWIEVSLLVEENSWDLFCQKAFADECCPPELEEVGKKMVRKCKGLPLAIVVVAGQLKKSSMAVEYWENVALSILSCSKNDEQCLDVLSLSYSYLPAHLKPCFLLLGAFAEDEKIYVSNVVKLWIAEGFIEHFEEGSLEEVAEYYILDLYQRNLILFDHCDHVSRKLDIFKLHDLVRELCLKIGKKEGFLCVVETLSGINRERRVVIRGEVNHQTKTKPPVPLRCLMYEGGWLPCDWKLLRTLDKVVTASTSESIFQQLNLRYVNVELDHTSHQTLYYLPSSISLLCNLQILTISTPDHAAVIAPYQIWEMLQLRHLDVHQIHLLDPLPTERSDDELVLRNLHTLGKVENFRLSEEACKRIPNVRVLRLSYSNSYLDEASSYYCPQNLCCFHRLEQLTLQFDGNSKWRDFVLSLTFPSSLTRLNLTGCGIGWEELTTIVGSLPHLQILELYRNSVIGCAWSPVEGKFLGLKHIEIWGCDDLIEWNADRSHFPVLQYLRLNRLSKLEEFPSDLGEIPTLEFIGLRYCSVSSTISAMRIVAEQEELGNDSLWLDVVIRGDEETLQSFNNTVQEEGLTTTNLSLHLVSA